MKVLLAILGGVVVVLLAGAVAFAAFAAVAGWRFEHEITETSAGVERREPTGPVDVATLPPLIREFATRAGASADCPIGTIAFAQDAEMRLGEGGEWIAGTAVHTAATGRTAFVWSARMAFRPLVGVRVIDAFVDGAGFLSARVFGAVEVASAAGPEASVGEAMRYLAEIPWNPEAILCNGTLRWTALGERSVGVETDTEGGPASVELHFDDRGDIVRAVGMRPRDDGERLVMTPWRGTFRDYRNFGGLRLPGFAEATWEIDGRDESYFRGTITSVTRGDGRSDEATGQR